MDHQHQLAASLLAHQARASHSRYPATSSAFSASAHPHEDWTKISDLAERRRIQNRIAQRNYRKKLKRRLEDLERKAGSTSASPEPQPAQLAQQKSSRKSSSSSSTSSESAKPQTEQRSLSSLLSLQDSLASDSLFKQDSLSPSPPTAFAYPISSSPSYSYQPFSSAAPHYGSAPASCDPFSFSYSAAPLQAPASWLDTAATGLLYKPAAAATPDYAAFADLELVNASFAHYHFAPTPAGALSASLDGYSYGSEASMPQTPPLSECHELYVAGGSPPDSAFLPQTPPMPFQAGPTMTMV